MAEKQLRCTTAASEHQKAWFADLRRDVFDAKKPYAILQADMPFELFSVMGVPVVSNQWWSAIISAKRQSTACVDVLEREGYHDGLCRYCSLSMASTIGGDRVAAPWGGLPKPALLAARLTCDCVQRVFSIWSEAFGSEFFPIDNPGAVALPARWWELSRHRWRELVEPHRLAFTVAQFHSLIAVLERITGRSFDLEALRALMEGVNRQEEYFEQVRDLICDAPKTPVRMNEQISNVMATQWLRGTEWAVSHARAFRDEVRERVDAGLAAYPGERIRLMWVGAGIWHDTDFYSAFEDDLGAVFVWSNYLAFGPDGYIRYGLDDPLAALASRTVNMNEQLHNPPWSNEWVVDQARRHRIDAAMVLTPGGMRPAATGKRFVERALEAAGIPTLPVSADMVDERSWDGAAMRARVRDFLRERGVVDRATAR